MNNSLKEAWGRSFLVGAEVNRDVLANKKADEILKKHFSSVTAGNAMKFIRIQPEENKYDWQEADLIANYARKNKIALRGHTIVWHNQVPDWLFLDGNENVSKNKLFKRLEDHIAKITERYNDAVYAWDVVNEAIDVDKGDKNNFRLSKWYKICGKEVFEFAFKCMRQACPKAKLFYNDYNNESGAKLKASLRYLSSLLDAGIPIDGVGIQGHWYYNFPDGRTLRNALKKYCALGLDIELTEVDISLYKWNEAGKKRDFFTVRPEKRILEQAKRYMEIFKIASDYPAVKNITMWGIADSHTWLDNFPVEGRKNWPLLFDENFKEKPVVEMLAAAGLKKN